MANMKDTLANRQKELILSSAALKKANNALERAQKAKEAADIRYDEARLLFRKEVNLVDEETKVFRN